MKSIEAAPLHLKRFKIWRFLGLSLVTGFVVTACVLYSSSATAQGCPVTPGTPGCGEAGPGAANQQTAARGAGDPIDIITGNNYQRQIDHAPRPNRLATDLVFVRHYSSSNVRVDRTLGPGWSHAYQVSLWATGTKQRQIIQSDGRRLVFDQNRENENQFQARTPGDGYLIYDRSFATWYLSDGRQMSFDANGWLERIRHRDGSLQQLTYDHKGRVERVTARNGDHLTLRYYPAPDLTKYRPGSAKKQEMDRAEAIASDGRLQSVTLPDGGVYKYRYDGLSNLTQMSGPYYSRSGDTTIDSARPPVREVFYSYDDENFPHALTGLSQAKYGERKTLVHTWKYDQRGRANHYHRGGTEEDGDVERVDLVFQMPGKSGRIGKTFLTNSLGEKSTYTWRHHWYNAQFQLLKSEGPGCSACPEPNVSYEYNDQNQVVAEIRKSGRTSYKYDDLGRVKEVSQQTPDLKKRRLIAKYHYEDSWNPSRIERPSIMRTELI